MMPLSLTRIRGLILRYVYLYTRSIPRVTELFFWPTMDLLVWGYVTVYLQRLYAGGESLPTGLGAITFLLGAMIFWDILYRAQQGVTLSFLEDIWTRNLLNMFVAPVRLSEFMLATFFVGMLRIFVTVAALTALAWWLYAFNLYAMGFALVAFFINLLIMGWAMGMVTTGLILRWGQAAEALAWGIPFLVQPIAAVFYPLDVLPRWVQPIAWVIPATHVFEGMRAVLQQQGFNHTHFLWAIGLNIVYLLGGALFFRFMYAQARARGLLAKLATQ